MSYKLDLREFFNLDLAYRKQIFESEASASLPRNVCVFNEADLKDITHGGVLISDTLSADKVIELVLSKSAHHVVQNSLQSLSEKIDFLNRLHVDREKFFDKEFSLLSGSTSIEFSFSQFRDRYELIETIFAKLKIDSNQNRFKGFYQVLNELVMNVQMDAVQQSRNNNKEDSVIKIEQVDNLVGLSVIDYYGSLNCLDLLSMISHALKVGLDKSIRFDTKGAGLGSSIIFNQCDSLILGSRPDKVTRISAIFPFNVSENDTNFLQKSLHVV